MDTNEHEGLTAAILSPCWRRFGRFGPACEWEEKLNSFLQFNDYEVLANKGNISRELALKLAEEAYEQFRVKQDQNYLSDFDRMIKKLKKQEDK